MYHRFHLLQSLSTHFIRQSLNCFRFDQRFMTLLSLNDIIVHVFPFGLFNKESIEHHKEEVIYAKKSMEVMSFLVQVLQVNTASSLTQNIRACQARLPSKETIC